MSQSTFPQISVIIPTMNAEQSIGPLLRALRKQTLPPQEIIVADSQSEDRTADIARELGATVLPVLRKTFNHGGTRDAALKSSRGDYVLFLTHDAIPARDDLIENLAQALQRDETVAAAYARQIPRADATAMERLVRQYNYPDRGHVYDRRDIQVHGIKTFFTSNACTMYKRAAYMALGGFERDVKTNEDMLFAAKAIHGGYAVAYVPEAQVIHSHNFTFKEQYQRNFIQGYEIERHKDMLATGSQNAAGMKLVKYVSKELLMRGKFLSWVWFGFDCCARYAGSWMGKRSWRKSRKNLH